MLLSVRVECVAVRRPGQAAVRRATALAACRAVALNVCSSVLLLADYRGDRSMISRVLPICIWKWVHAYGYLF